mgnify:FL=1
MDKETLIKLAQPAATTLLALSIVTLPFIAKASSTMFIEGALYMRPLKIECVSGC